MEAIRHHLWALQDQEYKLFHQKLMPTVNPDTIIGIRVPQLRAYAKTLKKDPLHFVFLQALPHRYYEENNLHAFLLEQIKDFEQCVRAVDEFLPYIDNWATCDMLRPKCFQNHTDELLPAIEKWLSSGHTYTVRFGIGMLMSYYLDQYFEMGQLDRVASIQSEEYYVNMMIAWYFATAFAKQYEAALPYLLENRLPVWVHNKTIQKAVESYRITPEQKAYLKTLKRK